MDDLAAVQQRLVQQERLRALGEMASGIAHDLNNTLAPVVGFSELLLETPGLLEDPARARAYVELIHTAALDAAGIVARLGEFYRQRRPGEVVQPVDVPALVEQVIALTRPRWQDQALADGRTIEVRTELEVVPPVAGHITELREGLTNLIFNAVDSMPGGGTITVGCRVRTPPDAVPGGSPPEAEPRRGSAGWVAIWVSDTGTGMSEETRRRCLEPFFSTKGSLGTGLGLPMVYGTVQRHGGELAIESQLRRGTTVTMWLPVYAAPEDADDAPSSARAVRPLRILVVDDEPSVRRVTEAYLAVDGHHVTGAGGGRETLEELRRVGASEDGGGFELVITDRAMPDISGEQLAAHVKALVPSLKVVLLTGFAGSLDEADSLTAVDVVLSKPVTLAALRAAIARLVPE